MAIETSFTAQQHFELVEYVLSLYGKTIDAYVAAIIADNCETMKCLSNLCSLPLVGCASHRYDLAVTKYIEKYEPLLKNLVQWWLNWNPAWNLRGIWGSIHL